MQGVVILGHSTGCQDAVRYGFKYFGSGREHIPQLLGLILQAPVSDQEYLKDKSSTARLLANAKEMVAEGHGEEIVGRAWDLGGTPVTARRFIALAERGGDDDMFSSYFSDQELQVGWFCLRVVATRFCRDRQG